jgi:hypothetical protein
VAALHCIAASSFGVRIRITVVQVLLLRSTFGLFPHHFVEHFRGRCAQDVDLGKRLKLLAGLVSSFQLAQRLFARSSHHAGPDSFWTSLWHARRTQRLEVARLWSAKLVSLESATCVLCFQKN